ncbi:MAG: GAF domain-containing protein [Anaerolineales bacterium]|nr:GAF domain-containing protein [Anaerolineales bacterium]MDW8278840.1 GAF domain-containing protein [Anaerolineales bacterium]
MNDTSTHSVDYRDLLRMHEANYAVFQAKTEKEIEQAILKAFQICPYAGLYYVVNEVGLERVLTYNPASKQEIEDAPAQIDLTPAEIVRFFAREPAVTNIQPESLPEALVLFLSKQAWERAAVIPVMQDVVVLGVLLMLAQPGEKINQDTIAPLIYLAEAIPTALDSVKAARVTKQRLRELESISETSQLISSSNNLEQLYELLHKQISTTIGSDVNVAIAIYEPLNETIEIPYMVQGGVKRSVEPFPLGEGLVSILIRTRQPLMLVEDTERRARALGAKFVGAPPKSWLGCPLVISNEAIGALVVQDLVNEQRFTQDDLRFLIALSAQVAGAIYNIRLLEEARRRALQLETVAEISREVSSSLIIDNLLLQAVNLLRERFNFYHAAVFLLDKAEEYAVIREATGEAGAQMKRAEHKLGVGSKSLVGRATLEKEAQVVNDVSKDQNYYPNPLLPDTKAEACLPLKVGDRVLGVLDVQSTRLYAFTTENIKILQILADQLAIAVVNSELFAEAQERLLQHRLFHNVTKAAASSTNIEEALNSAVQGLQVARGGDQIAILLSDKEQKTLEVRASIGYPNDESARLKIPFGVGITGWVAAHKQSQRVNDVTKDSRYIAVNSKVRSELALPLIYRNQVLGVLNIESTSLNAFTENDEEMLGTLAGSLAAIIAHSRLLEQYRQQVERERLLYEITSKVRRTTDPKKILAITAEELSKATNAHRTEIAIELDDAVRLPAASK